MAAVPQPWEELLRAPFPCDHIIQLYTDEYALIQSLTRFVGSGLEQGEAAIVIAVPEHIAVVTKCLTATSRHVAEAIHQGAFVSIDAKGCLAKFMNAGMPDRAAFRSIVTAALDRLRDAGYRKIRLFGEMVNLLWQENDRATVRLEELWNEVVADYQVSLLCAYRVHPLEAEGRRGILHQITRSHSHSFSLEEDYQRL